MPLVENKGDSHCGNSIYFKGGGHKQVDTSVFYDRGRRFWSSGAWRLSTFLNAVGICVDFERGAGVRQPLDSAHQATPTSSFGVREQRMRKNGKCGLR